MSNLWVARELDGSMYIYNGRPVFDTYFKTWVGNGSFFRMGKYLFPDLRPGEGPINVSIVPMAAPTAEKKEPKYVEQRVMGGVYRFDRERLHRKSGALFVVLKGLVDACYGLSEGKHKEWSAAISNAKKVLREVEGEEE